MKLLALDTSTEACSVALTLGGEITELFELEPRHGERILVMVDTLLTQAGLSLGQLDAIGFGRGPGSFTSLRIGAGVVQGLAFGADLPVVPVSSLAALAQGVDAPNVLAAFDARMRQVYVGAYSRGADGLVTLVGSEIVIDPASATLPASNAWVGAGSGWDVYHVALRERFGATVDTWVPGRHPRAREIANLAVAGFKAGSAVGAEQALPLYIRDDVAMKSAKR